MLKYLIGVLIGGGVGAILGAQRSCETGACPLTSNPYTGAIYGAMMGFLLVGAFFVPQTARQSTKEDSTVSSNDNQAVISVKSVDEFKAQVLGSDVPVLVDFWAPWCGPCRAQMPIVEQVAANADNRARVVKVNVDEAVDIAESFGVQSIPTLVVLNGGKEHKRFVGVQSAEVLKAALGV